MKRFNSLIFWKPKIATWWTTVALGLIVALAIAIVFFAGIGLLRWSGVGKSEPAWMIYGSLCTFLVSAGINLVAIVVYANHLWQELNSGNREKAD